MGNWFGDGYGDDSRAEIRGGSGMNNLWISEQMICKNGVKTRRDDYAAGRGTNNDNAWRSFDQVVHEFGHTIDWRYGLEDRINKVYSFSTQAVEVFPFDIQNWFGVMGTPGYRTVGDGLVWMEEIFSSKARFTCDIK